MSAGVARRPTREDHDLLGDYIDFCQQLGVSDRSMRDRLRAARSFLGTHPDLQVWMERPVSARLAELRRLPAWSLLGWAMLAGHVKADLDLLLLKDFGTLGATAEALFPEDFELARQGARRLLWTPDWTRSVLREGLVLTLAATGLSMRQLLQEDLDELRAAIDASPLLTPFARRRRKGQLFGVAQLLFECRLLPAPPRRPYPAAATPAERFSALPETELRAAMVRYVEVRSAVLARKSVDSLINDLLPFGEFLAGQQPEIVSLRQLDRGHIEAFLVYNRTRTWRGRKTRDKQVAPTVVHAAVLSLRNFLDDITLWGWAERPPR